MMAVSHERVLVVTGGNSGIGRGIARYFANRGFNTAVLGRKVESLAETAQEIGARCRAIRADVTKRDEVEAAVAAVVDEWGRIDVLINNAGVLGNVLTTTPPAEAEQIFRSVVDVNLTGTFLMTMAAAPHLVRPGGRIINISTIGAFRGGRSPGQAAYVAAKSGVHGLIHSFARELSPQGITVNGIAPGFIATPMTRAWTDERTARSVADILVGRPGVPEDIAAAAFYLASPEASFVTGEILNVNGGALFVH